MSVALIKAIEERVGQLHYAPYNIEDILVSIGLPPVPIVGLHYIIARYNRDRSRLRNDLRGGGVFVNNLNSSGVVEIGLLSESASAATIVTYARAGVAFPIASTDTQTLGTSSIAATECKLIRTPEWRRDRTVGVTVFTFETPRLLVNHGLRKTL